MIIENIENKIKLAVIISIGSFLTCMVIVAFVAFSAYKQVDSARKTIYILDSNNMPILARQTSVEMNRPAEYKALVDLYHSLFFNLTPDDKYIEYQMKKAMYLVDESGILQYNNLKEKGYFNSILSSSSVLTITTDSVSVDAINKKFKYYGRQKIERRSSTMIRSIVTEGELIDIPRSENNSHGVIISNWQIIENKDIDNVTKVTY